MVFAAAATTGPGPRIRRWVTWPARLARRRRTLREQAAWRDRRPELNEARISECERRIAECEARDAACDERDAAAAERDEALMDALRAAFRAAGIEPPRPRPRPQLTLCPPYRSGQHQVWEHASGDY